jgi:tRNA-specific 2-thiouridylase
MKVAVLLSGGVDSSVSLALLQEQGVDIVAFYIKIWLEDELAFLGQCSWEEDLFYARGVCEKFGVPLQIVSLQREYYATVVSYCLQELKAGRTPSPDIFCNQRIKFGAFYEKIGDNFDKVASGHYACVEEENGLSLLKTSPDPVKDQTYFLAHLSQKQLDRLLFPIGKMLKSQVRALAQKYNLPNKDRKDSQGICFLGKIKYRDFIKHHLGEKEGDIVESQTNKRLGTHLGYWYYTIGQRQGLGLSGGPWYVVKKDLAQNIIYVSGQYNKAELARDAFTVDDFNWITSPPAKKGLRVKIRHGEKFFRCQLTFQDEQASKAAVLLEEHDPGIAPGQFAVFYDNDICLGCGCILE